MSIIIKIYSTFISQENAYYIIGDFLYIIMLELVNVYKNVSVFCLFILYYYYY